MKKITIIIICIIMISCSKKNGSGNYCYRCTVSGMAGSRTLDTCSNVPATQYSFVDASGNDQSFSCEEK